MKFSAIGRRKKSSARVVLMPGSGKIEINGRGPEEYFCRPTLIMILKQPLQLTQTEKKYDIKVNVDGGGVAGQAGAVRHGIARALIVSDEKLRSVLKKEGFLTRDSRMKERKKYGRKKARKRFQFSKR
ncbi:30S ribosomal protein S9 [bacterium]|nr:30S ribosomal protein S9 [bacterium]